QVGSHRLIESQNLEAFFLDLDFHAVDRVVGFEDFGSQHGVAVNQGDDRLGNGFLDERADIEDFLLQNVDLTLNVLGHCDVGQKSNRQTGQGRKLALEFQH